MSVEAQATKPATSFHPHEDWLRSDRLPHIWCPECGIGTTVSCLTTALEGAGLSPDEVAVVSGIGCSGRVAGYLKIDSFHTTHGRAIPFATGLALANPRIKPLVVSGDGDLIAIGGNHFIHAARRNVDMTVLCINNFNYAMTGGQVGPTTPVTALASTTPYGAFEHPFNLPALAAGSGAVYVARWTALHVRRTTQALQEALTKPGFSFVEVISPCPTLYTRKNKLGSGLDLMRVFRDRSVIKHGASAAETEIEHGGPIVLGKFVDVDKPTLQQRYEQAMERALGDEFRRLEGSTTVQAARRSLRKA